MDADALESLWRMYWAHCGDDTHVGMRDEFGLGFGTCRPWACGFSNLADLEVWFDGYRDALAAGGFVLRVYQVSQLRQGGIQAIAPTAEIALGNAYKELELTS